MSFKLIFILAVAIAGIIFLVDLLRVGLLIHKSAFLVKKSEAYQRSVADAPVRILILGDSTAVGTGVMDPTMSTAGRLGTLYPNANISNLAQNGLRLEGLLEVMEKIDQERYDLVLVQIGANDVIRLTGMEDIKKDIDRVVSQLSKQATKVILLHSGNIGESNFFPWYIKPLMSKRSHEIRDIYIEVSSRHNNVKYVDLIESEAGRLLRENPDKYYADDKLHLSDEGYGLWFEVIQKDGDI